MADERKHSGATKRSPPVFISPLARFGQPPHGIRARTLCGPARFRLGLMSARANWRFGGFAWFERLPTNTRS
jgi:hypothetical protein